MGGPLKIKAIFVTGTDTGVGKSVISGLLGRYLLDKGYQVITQKWIETGSHNFSQDIKLHLKLMKKTKKEVKYYLPYLCCYQFKFAASPHLAAKVEKKTIRIKKIKQSFKLLFDKFDFVIVEGIGGGLVPFKPKKLVIDIAKELDLPVLIVSNNKLGAINHTLLTVEAMKMRNMAIIGIIWNNLSKKVNSKILKDNPRIVEKITGQPNLGTLPRLENRQILYNSFIPIGKKIFTCLVHE